ncbi:MAG: MBL fold metallo-hydrolase [Vicinamibacterales bacterium]
MVDHAVRRLVLLLAVTVVAAAPLSSSGQPAPRPALEARFIGNMAYAISDGQTTLFTDFPYQSGYSVYMEYDAAEIRSRTPAAVALITHRHGDHWDGPLFNRTNWRVVAPADALTGVAAPRIAAALPVKPAGSTVTVNGIAIDAIPTPHAGMGHYSYIVSWRGQRLFFSGDTEDPAALLAARNLDVAFVSPWLFQSVRKSGRIIDARRIVIYHQTAAETTVAGCGERCTVPKQGDTLTLR